MYLSRQHAGRRPDSHQRSAREVYKRRNLVEGCFNRLKQWRGIATRYDKIAQSHEAAVALASLLMWAWHLTTDPSGAARTRALKKLAGERTDAARPCPPTVDS
ncbi:transposase [Streptomyces sp. NPDC055107]